MTNNPLQSQFYKELHQWIQDGFPRHKVFLKNTAICTSYERWLKATTPLEIYDRISYEQKMKAELKQAFGNSICPFNESLLTLLREGDKEWTYYNPERLKWIALKASEETPKEEPPNE